MANNAKLIDYLSEIPKPCVYVGDFNFPGICWETYNSNNEGQALLEWTQNNFVTQHVDFSSYVNGNFLYFILISNHDLKILLHGHGIF